MMTHRRGFVRWLPWIAAALVLVLAAAWVVRWFITPVVSVVHLSRGPVVQAFYATGTVQPVREFPIKSATEGYLDHVYVDKGDHIKAGQPLAVVNNPSLVYAAQRAKADLDEKLKRIDPKTSPVLIEYDDRLRIDTERRALAQREVDRLQSMTKISAVAASDVDKAIDRVKLIDVDLESTQKQRAAKVLELQRELATAQSAYDIAQWELGEQTLKAPIDAVVLDRPTSQGTRVAVNDVIMRTADVRPSNLVMRAQVDEEDVTHCHVGQVVRMSLYAFAGERITGVVKQIYDEADADRRTFEVDVTFDHPDPKLAAGMTGELAFIEEEKADADILPSTALQNGAFYVVKDGKISKSQALPGLRSIERVEVLSGLDAGDAVIVSPLGTLTEGSRVRATLVNPAVIEQQTKAQNEAASPEKKPF